MTTLTRWQPFHELTSIQDRMNRLFQDLWSTPGWNMTDYMGSFTPAVDVYEDDESLRLMFEIPGVDEKNLNVQIENDVLTVSGERKWDADVKEDNFRRVERRYGAFSRSLTLPASVDTRNIEANYVNGVLSIRLLKRAEARPKQIKVNVPKALGKAA